MMPEALYQALLELTESLGREVREAELDGEGGSVELKGRQIVFVPKAIPAALKARVLAGALSNAETDSMYLLPAVREAIERERWSSTRSS